MNAGDLFNKSKLKQAKLIKPKKKKFNASIYYQEYQDSKDIICFIKTGQETYSDREIYRDLVMKGHVVCVISLSDESLEEAFELIDQRLFHIQKQFLAFRLSSTDTYLVGVGEGAYYATMFFARYNHRRLKNNSNYSRIIKPEAIKGIIYINGVHEQKKQEIQNSLDYIDEHFPKVGVIQVQKNKNQAKSIQIFVVLNKYEVKYSKLILKPTKIFKNAYYPRPSRERIYQNIHQFTKGE